MRIAKGNELQRIFSFHCKTCKTLFLSCYLSLAVFSLSTSLLVFVWLGLVEGGVFWMGLLTIHKAFSSSCWKKAQLKSVSCLFMIRGCGGIKAGRMKAPKLPVSSCFPQRRFFFFSPKDDASFQGVFNLQTVSSVYFTTVKCIPFRSYLSLLKLNLSFSAVVVATQKNKCDL